MCSVFFLIALLDALYSLSHAEAYSLAQQSMELLDSDLDQVYCNLLLHIRSALPPSLFFSFVSTSGRDQAHQRAEASVALQPMVVSYVARALV